MHPEKLRFCFAIYIALKKLRRRQRTPEDVEFIQCGCRYLTVKLREKPFQKLSENDEKLSLEQQRSGNLGLYPV